MQCVGVGVDVYTAHMLYTYAISWDLRKYVATKKVTTPVGQTNRLLPSDGGSPKLIG